MNSNFHHKCLIPGECPSSNQNNNIPPEKFLPKMPEPIIHINGWPGVSKHTIANELQKQMGDRGRVVS